jgi:hypothetical protein
MTTLRTPPVSKLGIQLQNYRADRPDEWNMDEFTRTAEAMELRIKNLEFALIEAKGFAELIQIMGTTDCEIYKHELKADSDLAITRINKGLLL